MKRSDAREAAEAVAKHGSIRAAARALGMAHTTVQCRLEAARRMWPGKYPTKDETAAQAVAVSVEERGVIAGLKRTNAQLKSALRETELAVSFRDEHIATILGLQSNPPEAPDWLRRKKVGVGSDDPGTPMFLWCDWHIGETVDPAQVYGVNQYDEETTSRRIETLVSRSLYLATKHRRVANVDGAVVLLNGDFVSGWQHEEHIATDWCTPLEAVRFATSRLRWGLEKLRDALGPLLIVCCAGNHGREREGGFHRKPPAKMSMFTAYDWLIYGFLEDTLGSKSGYTFCIPAANNHIVRVHSTTYNVQHGHELGVKGGDGLIGSIGPMMRGRQKAGRANAAIGRHFDQLVLGHFHQNVWMPDQGLIVGNTLKGFDEHAKRENYVATTPSQLMWWTHPLFGPTSNLQVYVEDPRSWDRGMEAAA